MLGKGGTEARARTMTMTHVHHHDTQTVASRFCGHCGTEVSGGYTVCAACGANYRRKGRGLYIGILLGVLGVQALVTGEWEGAVVLLGVGFLLIRHARQRAWYRRNA